MGNDLSYAGLYESTCFEDNVSLELYQHDINDTRSTLMTSVPTRSYSLEQSNLLNRPSQGFAPEETNYGDSIHGSSSVEYNETPPWMTSWVMERFPCLGSLLNIQNLPRCLEFIWCSQFENENKTTLYTTSYLKPHIVGLLLDDQDGKLSSYTFEEANVSLRLHSSSSGVLKNVSDLQELQCSICLDVFDRPVVTTCHHIFCYNCIYNSLGCKEICPLCRSPVQRRSLKTLTTLCRDDFVTTIQRKFFSLFVICPQCNWKGNMQDWTKHMHSHRCGRMSKRIYDCTNPLLT